MYDERGKARCIVALYADGRPYVALTDPDGRHRVHLGSNTNERLPKFDTGGVIFMSGSNGRETFSVSDGDTGTSLVIHDPEDRNRWQMGLSAHGRQVWELMDANGELRRMLTQN